MNSNSRNVMRALAVIGALAATTVVGCDISKTLSVEPANLIPAVTLEAPENAALLVAGAASDFDCAFNSFVVVGALIGEEFEDALQTADSLAIRSANGHRKPVDATHKTAARRSASTRRSRRRASPAATFDVCSKGGPTRKSQGANCLIARTSAYEAWSQLLIAEAFCETVFSTIKGETIEWGTKITRAQALDSAIARFSSAITTAQGVGGVAADSIRYFSLVGRARAIPGQRQHGGGARRRGAGAGGIRLERDGVEQQHAPAESRLPGEQYRDGSVVVSRSALSPGDHTRAIRASGS